MFKNNQVQFNNFPVKWSVIRLHNGFWIFTSRVRLLKKKKTITLDSPIRVENSIIAENEQQLNYVL